MSDLHALSGAYAVDALDDVERARFERHLTTCADCRTEVADLREAAALLPEASSTPPPSALRARVLREIDSVRPLPPVVPTRADDGRPRRRRPLLLAAAAVVLIALGGAVVTGWQPWADESSSTRLTATEEVLAAPDAESWTKRFDDGSRVTLTRSESLNRAVVQTRGMAPAGADEVFALWLQHDDDMVPAGVMPPGPDNTVLLEGDPGTASAFAVSREPVPVRDDPTRPPLTKIDF